MAKKQGQNMGSIYHRKDGRWVGQVTIEGKQHYKYFKTQREARVWRNKILLQIDEGLTFVGTQISLGEYLEFWLGSVKSSLRPNTMRQYTHLVNNHILPRLRHIKLKDLRPDRIQWLLNIKLQEGLSERTVELIYAVLRRSLNQGLQQGLIGRNPVLAVTKPKPKRKEMQTLTDTQVRTLLLNTKGTRFEVLYQLAVTTGLRKGEILGIRWSDLDWSKRRLHIQRQLLRIPNQGLIFSEPKSQTGRRVVVLGAATLEKLHDHLNLQQRERILAGERWKENDLIFPSTIGTPMEPRNLIRHFKKTLKESGLPAIRFHDLRHTSATLQLQQGINPKIVQERLGHSSISLTLDTYSHVLPDMQNEVAETMDEILTPIEIGSEIKEFRGQ
ncbi:tyrosine-type recombinase/integrase [Chloroflexota bacterium]